MTYAGFLLLFLLPPIALLGWRAAWPKLAPRLAWLSVLGLALVALLYTTPWDNYLVSNRIWWYDPARVSGVTLGWVPLEEYLFFVLQPLVTGLWALFVLSRARTPRPAASGWRLRNWPSVAVLGLLWTAAGLALWSGRDAERYLALILIWAIPPLALQMLYGADQLWLGRWQALAAVLPPTLYLAAADALAIQVGVWTINPRYSTGLLLGGVLPVEEFLFFLLTNCLVGFGILLLSPRWFDRADRQQI